MDTLPRKIMSNGFSAFQIHYFAQLPYNLNWMVENLGSATAFFRENLIVVADVGSRGGCPEELSGLRPYIDYSAFDADVNANGPSDPLLAQETFHPYFIGREDGRAKFYHCKSPGHSSGLEPNVEIARLFGVVPEVERVEEVSSRCLDSLVRENVLKLPDFLKLDTQGTELSILQGAKELITQCNLVEVEVEFVELYKNQPLFPQVCEFMFGHGFQLLYLNRLFQCRSGYEKPARGQILFGDALFARPEESLPSQDLGRLAKYVLLLANYGHLDLAAQIYEVRGISRVVDLSFLFRPSALSPDDQAAMVARDKHLCWALSERKTNQLSYDSDRSWPFR